MVATLQENSQESLYSFLKESFAVNVGEGPLGKIQEKAWRRFLDLGFPNRRLETFRSVPLHLFYKENFIRVESSDLEFEKISPYIYKECQKSVIVFVDGCFSEKFSDISALPKQVVLSSLSQATKTYGTFLTNRWTRSLQEESDSFSVLNAALQQEGAFCYIPPRSRISVPLQVLHVTSPGLDSRAIFPRFHLFCGADCEITLVGDHACLSSGGHWMNQVYDFSLEEGARVHYVNAAFDVGQAWHFDALRVNLKRNAFFKSVAFTQGSSSVRHDYRAVLAEENAQVELNGVWALGDKNHAHTNILVRHEAPYCKSSQVFKGILSQMSSSSFFAKIYVAPEAQKTEAFQRNNHILLSDLACAKSVPNLEIFADDVKASHGVTVGQLNKEHLYYLESRGIPKSIAKGLLLSGFCKEVIEQIALPEVFEKISKYLQQYLLR